MIPLFSFRRPGVPRHAERRHYQCFGNIKTVQHQVVDCGQGNRCFSESHVKEKGSDRMLFNIICTITLIIVWFEFHYVSLPFPGSWTASISGIFAPTLLGIGLPGSHSFRAPITGPICSTLSTQNTGKPKFSSCCRRLRCRGRICFPGAFSSTKAHFPPSKRTSRSGTPFMVCEVNFNAFPPPEATASTIAFSTSFSRTAFSPSSALQTLVLGLLDDILCVVTSFFFLRSPRM